MPVVAWGMGDLTAARAALERVRSTLGDGDGKPYPAAVEARGAVLAMAGEAQSGELVHALVDLAREAKAARQSRARATHERNS